MSDSRRNWREDVFEVIKSGVNKLHILTHPIWYRDNEKSMKEILYQFVKEANVERYLALKANIRDLDEVLLLDEI